MRSTRYKLKMLRGIGRASSNGGDGSCGLPYRKQVHYQPSANFHAHSSSGNGKSNNGSNQQQTQVLKSESGTGNKGCTRIKPYNQHQEFRPPSAASRCYVSSGETNNNTIGETIQSLTWSDIHSSTTATMDCELNSEIRAKAFAICRDYLHGVWKRIDARDLIVKRIR